MPNVIVGVSKDYAGTFDEALSEVKSWGLPVSSTLPELGVIVAAVEPHREQESWPRTFLDWRSPPRCIPARPGRPPIERGTRPGFATATRAPARNPRSSRCSLSGTSSASRCSVTGPGTSTEPAGAPVDEDIDPVDMCRLDPDDHIRRLRAVNVGRQGMRVELLEEPARMGDQVGVALEQVGAGHPVNVVKRDPEVFDRGAGALQRESTGGSRRETSPPWARWKNIGQYRPEQPVFPDVCSPGAGVPAGPKNRADAVVLEPGREDVGRAVTERVGHEHNRPLILLAHLVGVLGRLERKSLRIDLAGLARQSDRGLPAAEFQRLRAFLAEALGRGRVSKVEPLGFDRAGRERLEQCLPARMLPPPLPLTSMIKPVRGSCSRTIRMNSATNVSGLQP